VARLAVLRGDERAVLAAAGVVLALASAGAAMSAAAADAMFLSEIGTDHLGVAVAVSNALLAVVLAVVGGLADRLERRRVLATLAMASAAVIGGLAAMAAMAPQVAAAITLVVGKQLAAATDLAFWVVIAERLDARRSQRLLPVLAAMGGAGAAVGAVLVIPLARLLGARGVLACAAVLLAIAGLGTSRLAATRRVAAVPGSLGGLIARSWRDGARAVRRHPLAQHLAIVVAAAGVFASLAYFALGVGVAARGDSTSDLAALLGGVRGVGQILTLAVQLVIAPRLLLRVGTGQALLLAPLAALAAGLGLVAAPILAVAIATQVSARVLDTAVETPAEKLAQTLLPTAVRGRIAGFLDGPAKRAGAAAGGLIAAALAGVPTAFYLATALAAAVWLVAARRIARELPALAIEQVVHASHADVVVDDRAIAALVRELAGPHPDRAAEVLVRLHERGRVDAVGPLVRAVTARGEPALWRALVAVLDAPAEAHGASLVAAASGELAIRALGLAGGVPVSSVDAWCRDADPAVAFTAAIARHRLAGEDTLDALAEASRESGPTARVALDELCVEIARAHAANAVERALDASRHLARALRRTREAMPRAAPPASPRSRASSIACATTATPSSRCCAPTCSISCASASRRARASRLRITCWCRS
jgi:hypothetical protein